MADRIFPNRIQDEALDSDLVFQGIDWDTFNQRLADAQSGEKKRVPTELLNALNKAHPEAFREVADVESGSMYAEKGMDDDMSDDEAMMVDSYKTAKKKKGLDPTKGLGKYLADKEENEQGESEDHDKDHDDKDHDKDHDKHDDEDDDEKDGKGPMKRKGPKSKDEKKKSYAFNHPSQISAEAIETALANGDQELANVILAVRHERRVRLAEKIERQIVAQNTQNVKLAQRKAYRQNIVDSLPVGTSKKEVVNSDEFVKVSSMNNSARKAFAAKAIQNGFPAEYVQAMLGETVKVDNLSDIKKVMASELEPNVKVAAIKSMTKVATLTNDDYKRLKDYWKNELGYAEAWVDELFTQEYDK
jgi:hypothetical protein